MIPERFLEPLEFAANELKGLLRAENDEDVRLVQKGLMLFRQGLVYQLRFDGDKVSATVQDVTPAKVELDLEFIHLSECSCPAEGFCRHQTAVFLQLLSKARSVSMWIEEWRKPIKEKQTAKNWGLQRAKDLLKSSGQKKNTGYDGWIDGFEESFTELLEKQGEPRPYVLPELFHVYLRRMKAGAPVEQEWKLLYLLIGYVFSFKKLMALSRKYGHGEELIDRYYRHLYQSLMEDSVEIMNKLSVHSLPFAFDQFIEKLKDDSAGLINSSFGMEYERTHLYRLLWTHFFKKKEWRETEIERLEPLVKEEANMPSVAGFVHLQILERNDEQALRILNVPNVLMTPYILYWLDYFSANKDWNRMGPYAEAFIHKLRDYLKEIDDYYACMDFTRMSIKAISPYCLESSKMDLYEKALMETLPYSYNDYEYLLFEKGEFMKWADLQAFIGFDLDSLGKDRIREISKKEPSILLPLYHQSITGHINMKNRDHYREAVRKMKKLRTLYNKLKRQDDWQLFLELLLEKTKRLRAFQEECKRGKLIDA
ncbi:MULTISPECIES: SWIM zinc finger family protein [Cytobacillus]|uniref:SWIM zinc finger family protein n=1 Tax=Cytobacillus TaxID=2675230 RepID=UPI00203D70BC|nr:SWIM zinc finger family protein [Cytobacillus firmus]MCM3707315.1 SWIM zinc finger family protein [Cytobacillus firmus]